MDEEEVRKTPSTHEVGMVLDAISEEELQSRIGLLEREIARLKAAIEARRKTRSDAENFFKF
ncbi:DUF1192 domain-containing protein [Paradevosia shaoguanensis]|jgi:uncharacterized small protein (DUF1192 family)|uniref:DUF1192 domain-containing protein n=1 Tax=Paradevosia shaoguanensis TaxID=1335043 RepID=UPI000455CB99|nr:DUF1192 domain-containing protein [Paradevosia shaoguanensis]MBI4048552.1 DUF1192 domain-containing protein [Devosia nanyangense]QMV01063.1 DUF1192 family protein [Devosia sp. D6-9]CDP50280.1 hypothetical protein [Devosia sp. DBB001]